MNNFGDKRNSVLKTVLVNVSLLLVTHSTFVLSDSLAHQPEGAIREILRSERDLHKFYSRAECAFNISDIEEDISGRIWEMPTTNISVFGFPDDHNVADAFADAASRFPAKAVGKMSFFVMLMLGTREGLREILNKRITLFSQYESLKEVELNFRYYPEDARNSPNVRVIFKKITPEEALLQLNRSAERTVSAVDLERIIDEAARRRDLCVCCRNCLEKIKHLFG